MLASAMDEWLAIIARTGVDCGWDESLIFSFMPDEFTLVFQVRKSPLVFTVKQQAFDLHRFTVSYTGYEPGAPRDVTLRRFGPASAVPTASVSAQLERWLRASVARYAAETRLPD